MTERLLVLSQKEQWNHFFNKLPILQQDIYFTPDYYELYERNGDGKACCFIFESNNDTALYPFLINSVNQLGLLSQKEEYYDIEGAYGYNGVVSSSYKKKFIESFYKSFSEYCKDNNIIAEFVRFHPILQNHKFSENHMDVFFNRKTVYLNLEQSYDDLWKYSYSSINRNMIRKARKINLSIITDVTDEDYNDFFRLYTETMKKKSADEYYLFSQNYFWNLRNTLNENHRLMKVQYEGKTTCMIILMIKGIYAHYYLSALDYGKKSFGSNNYILDAAIKLAISKCCKNFHFGGGDSREEDNTLLKFKSSFSKTKAEFYIGRKIHNKKIYDKICTTWGNKFPVLKEKYKDIMLKYRKAN